MLDTSSKAPIIELIPIVKEFLHVFPNDLHGIPLKRKFDFGINLFLNTKPIYISPYHIAQ